METVGVPLCVTIRQNGYEAPHTPIDEEDLDKYELSTIETVLNMYHVELSQ